MPQGNGQTQRVAQSSEEDCECICCSEREDLFTCAKSSDHQGGGNFFSNDLKDLGSLRS
jgi:hypothetical protein